MVPHVHPNDPTYEYLRSIDHRAHCSCSQITCSSGLGSCRPPARLSDSLTCPSVTFPLTCSFTKFGCSHKGWTKLESLSVSLRFNTDRVKINQRWLVGRGQGSSFKMNPEVCCGEWRVIHVDAAVITSLLTTSPDISSSSSFTSHHWPNCLPHHSCTFFSICPAREAIMSLRPAVNLRDATFSTTTWPAPGHASRKPVVKRRRYSIILVTFT